MSKNRYRPSSVEFLDLCEQVFKLASEGRHNQAKIDKLNIEILKLRCKADPFREPELFQRLSITIKCIRRE